MADLSITYAGLKLRNPFIISSSGLTNSVDKIRKLDNLGAGAVVLKSLFEECLDETSTKVISIKPEMVSKGGFEDDGYKQQYHEMKDKYMNKRNNLFSFLGVKF